MTQNQHASLIAWPAFKNIPIGKFSRAHSPRALRVSAVHMGDVEPINLLEDKARAVHNTTQTEQYATYSSCVEGHT